MLTLLLLLAVTVTPPDLTAPEVRISIHPSSMDSYQLLKRKTPDTYTCTALVTQAGTEIGYVSAELVVRPGHPETVTKYGGEYALDFSVTLKSQRAEAVATVKRGGKLLTRQRSTVYLKMDEGAVPIH
jgi:hypothetical protein